MVAYLIGDPEAQRTEYHALNIDRIASAGSQYALCLTLSSSNPHSQEVIVPQFLFGSSTGISIPHLANYSPA
jgi:hypothetical protein